MLAPGELSVRAGDELPFAHPGRGDGNADVRPERGRDLRVALVRSLVEAFNADPFSAERDAAAHADAHADADCIVIELALCAALRDIALIRIGLEAELRAPAGPAGRGAF